MTKALTTKSIDALKPQAKRYVVTDPAAKPGAQFGAGLEGVQVDAFVFQRPPEPFDEDVVHPAAASVHADPHGLGAVDTPVADRVTHEWIRREATIRARGE